jgi:phage-related protein
MNRPKLSIKFYKSGSNREPVREWLKALDEPDRKTIGDEIRLVQYGWPVGMPLVRKRQTDLWEVRITLADRIARVLLTVYAGQLRGFIKNPQNTRRRAANRQKSPEAAFRSTIICGVPYDTNPQN